MESFNNFIEQVRLDEALDETTTQELIRRLVLAPKMKKIVRFYLDWRRKNPGQGNRGIQKVIQIMGLNPRDGNQLILTLNKLVDKGDLPKHLRINIPNLESFLEKACWDSHKQVGMKKKNGKMVPNCVAKEDFQLDEKIEGLVTKAEKSGVPYGILKKVYDRGMAAWKTGHRPGTTPQQWAFARVNSFLTGGKTRTTADADLWKQAKGKKEEIEDSREIGTDASRQERQKMTPGQKVFSFKEHLNCGTPDCCNECAESSLIESNQYRVGSEKYYEFFNEKRSLYERGELSPVGFDKELLEGDIGKYDTYDGEHVPLDCPMMESEYQGQDVELNKPKVGGSKKYYVYVKDGDKVKKVSWGDTSGLKVKLNDKEARKSFAARHDCANKKDKTKAGYWACNLPRYAKQLGLSGGGNFFW